MPLAASPACLLAAVQEVCGSAHWRWRQTARCSPSSQRHLAQVFAKFAQHFLPSSSVPLTWMARLRAILRYLCRNLPAGACYRDDTSVGFCDATTEMMSAPSLEIGRFGRKLEFYHT